VPNRISLQIERRQAFADSAHFGAAGAYERLDGLVHYAVSPDDPAQAGVIDLSGAARNVDGLVEFSADLCILKPVDSGLGNRRVFFGYGNRGNMRELQFFNDAVASNKPSSAKHAGNGFLLRRGYTMVWAGWEGDLLPGNGRLRLHAPTATNGGQPITGVQRTEFVIDAQGATYLPLSGQTSAASNPTASMDTGSARLTRRRYSNSERELISPAHWQFARVDAGEGRDGQGGEVSVVDSDQHIYLPAGFEPGWLYELVYTAREPKVLGLGHVAVRDLVSFLKYGCADANDAPNPVGVVEKAYAWGRSQTGRCIRDFLHQGFNADASGRRVFDGVMPHVSGGGLMWMNHRFANVISLAGQEYEEHLTPADRFPFSYAMSTDHLSGVSDAILTRPDTDPLVMHTQTSTEYWQRRGSLVHTDTEGKDLQQPDNVRVYLWSSSQHFADANRVTPSKGVGLYYENIVSTTMLFRSALDALDAWASHGILPPESRIPKVSEGTLVKGGAWREKFPDIPGVMVPREPNSCPRTDFGQTKPGIITKQPPDVVGQYTVLVPSVDEDGNDVAGVRAPMVQAPLGTYPGWNIRRRGFGYGAMYEFTGSYIPFPDSPEEQRATRDPRPSVLERYGSPQGYVDAIEHAARALVEERLMLDEDVERAMQRARDWGRPLHDVKL
jgi:hypothetical protein